MEWDIGCPVFHSRLCLVSLSHTNQVSHPPTTPSTHSTHPHSIPSNTAIYQSVSAIVFIISVPVLKERVTVLKVRVIITCIMQYVSLSQILCVLVSIGGVFIVAFFSTGKDNCSPASNITNGSTGSGFYYNDEPCEPELETSTPLGFVVC